MIISYKKQFPWNKPTDFKNKILSGTKIHTIREDKHGRWTPGKKIHHVHGARTKYYDCFLENECVSVQKISIIYGPFNNEVKLFIGDKKLYHRVGDYVACSNDIISLSKNDGFDSVDDFFRWFNADFQGRIIHWTDLRY